jgi:hypothetical protein
MVVSSYSTNKNWVNASAHLRALTSGYGRIRPDDDHYDVIKI